MKQGKLIGVMCLVVLIFNIAALAGSLEPSTAPSPTMKPLDQIEPRIPITSLPLTIAASGSYYLTQNLTATGTAITVNADDVTIDLCGYTLTGPNSVTNNGISINGHNNIEIRNGTVRNFLIGINATSGSNKNRIIGVRCAYNTRAGISLYGNNQVIKDCTANDNGVSASGAVNVYGIFVAANCIVTGNTVYNNGNSVLVGPHVTGISADLGSIVSGNTVYSNGFFAASGSYVYGITVGDGSTVSGNTVYGMGTGGTATVYAIYAGSDGCKVSDNIVRNNAGIGINTRNCAIISGNSATGNTSNGIAAGAYCSIINNNVGTSGGYGITTGDHCNVTGDTSSSNTNNGINAGYYCTISNCTANLNTQRGIYAADYSTVTNCTASLNSQDGIWVMSYCTVTGSNAGNNQKNGIFCWRGKVMGNTVGNNNQINDTGSAGIQVWYGSQVRDNMVMDNKQNNLYVHDVGSSIENNAIHGSTNGTYFSSSSGNYFNNNRVDNVTTPWANIGTNINGGGNVSF